MSLTRRIPLLALLPAVLFLAAGSVRAACPDPLAVPSGEDDGFLDGLELPAPDATYLAWAERFWVGQAIDRRYDQSRVNAALLHTFRGWRGPVCGATLTLRVRATGDALSSNDSVRLGLKGGNDMQAAFHYWVTFRRVLGEWGPGQEAEVVLDLADLPEYGGFPTDILFQMSDGDLEFMVEDDTDVDYARLDVCRCHAAVSAETPYVAAGPVSGDTTPVEGISWGRLKSRFSRLD